MNTPETDQHRDADSLRIIGSFFVALGLLVLVATAWATESTRAMVVNIGSGTVLAVVGAVMLTVSRWLRARQ